MIKWHPDWPGYGGDEDGNIHSHIPGRRPRILRPWTKKCGHQCVSLRRDGKTYKILVHRFILELFVGPCPPGMEACHGEEGPRVNAVRNLRWDSRRENTLDRVRHGGVMGNGKMTGDQVLEAMRLHKEGWSYTAIGRKFGVTGANIAMIAKGKTWSWFVCNT